MKSNANIVVYPLLHHSDELLWNKITENALRTVNVMKFNAVWINEWVC